MSEGLQIEDQTKIARVSPITLRGTRGYREWVFVRIRTDHGIEGIGKGFTWPGQASAIRSHIETIGHQISGSSPVGIGSFLKRFLPQAAVRSWYAAIPAIEIALWDILGQMAGLPIYALFGGAVHREIPLYADHGIFDGAQDWEERVERILAAKEAGFAMFKWDPFVGEGVLDSKVLGKQGSQRSKNKGSRMFQR